MQKTLSCRLLAVLTILLGPAWGPPSARQAAELKAASSSDLAVRLQASRSSPLDLEVSGDLVGLPAGTTRYLTRMDLLRLPLVTQVVTDDTNFSGPTEISGLPLEELLRHLARAAESDMVIAICDDRYRAHYLQAYIAAHHPLLVITVNGQPPQGWPKDAEGSNMGPYMISHVKFSPSFQIFSHRDEPQVPWGVVRLEFRNERAVLAAIAPRGSHATEAPVQAGYRIAQQNCFRCHNLRDEGGQKSGHPWQVLSAWAAAAPDYFAAYVRNPQAKNPRAQMPGNPGYDDATIHALTAYFQTFAPEEKP
jgi:mono/diheme cytochrome c family protein